MTIIDLYKRLFGRTGIEDGNVIDMSEHGRTGGVNTGQGYKFTRKVDEKTLIDEASATVTYIGKASHGADLGAEVWQIKRVSISGNVTTISFADGNENYDNEWDERAGYSYS